MVANLIWVLVSFLTALKILALNNILNTVVNSCKGLGKIVFLLFTTTIFRMKVLIQWISSLYKYTIRLNFGTLVHSRNS